MQIQSKIRISAPASAVFQHLIEPDKLRQWLGGFVSSRPLDGIDHRVGARAAVTIEENGRSQEMISEILEIEQNRFLKVDVSGGPINTVSEYQITALADGELEFEHRMDVKFGGMMGLFSPFLRGVVKKKMQKDLAFLKAAVEA